MKKNLFILFCLFSLVVQAQWTKYTSENTSKKYFENYRINAIVEDSKGNKWFGTDMGLTKFDGQNWSTYTKSNGLVNNSVNCIAIDSLGYMWIGTGGGVSKYDGNKWTNYTTANGLYSNVVLSIAIDAVGNKWFATNKGISKFTGSQWFNYTYTYGFDYSTVRTIAFAPNGTMWVGYNRYSGLRKLEAGSWYTYDQDVFYFNSIYKIKADNQGFIWVATGGGGVVKLGGGYMTTYTTQNGLSSYNIYSIAIDSNGNKWFGTDNGVTKLSKDGFWSKFNKATSGLTNDTINDILADRKGNLWFGTNNGVSMYDGSNWKTYNNENRLISDDVQDIAFDKEGNKWILNGYYLTKFDGQNWNHYYKSGLRGIRIDSQGKKWLATNILEGYYSKLYSFDGSNWTTLLAPTDNYATYFATDNQGIKWFGTNGSGILSYDDKNWKTFKTSDGLVDNNIYDIAIDSNGNKWIATPKGISMFDGSKWITYNSSNSGLVSNSVNSIALDKQGNKWFGTTEGIFKFDGKNWTSFKGASGINFNNVRDIKFDNKGIMWFISLDYSYSWSHNITKFDGINWTNYNKIKDDGIPDAIHSLAIDTEGNKWFGTSEGILVYHDLSTGIFDPINAQTTFNIYPNPTRDFINLDLKQSFDKSAIFSIYDIHGKLIITTLIANMKTQIDLKAIPSGMYFCQLRIDGLKLETIKIVKK